MDALDDSYRKVIPRKLLNYVLNDCPNTWPLRNVYNAWLENGEDTELTIEVIKAIERKKTIELFPGYPQPIA